jgi:solute carrier family 25 (mitochondrial phosphate transporter), member 3
LNENADTCPLDEFATYAKLLTPDNCIIERCSEAAFESVQSRSHHDEGCGLKKEKWYGVEYYLSRIASTSIAAWNGSNVLGENQMDSYNLHLPKPNRYIPRTLELCPDLPDEARKGQRINNPIDPPNLLVDEEKWKLYHRLDDRYALPQANIHLLIRNIALQNIKCDQDWMYDARTALISSLIAGIFNEAMAQETYDADLAGLYWTLFLGAAGIKLNCFGFSDRLPDLGLRILSDFLSGDFLNERYFVSSRDRVVRGLKTYFESKRADSQAAYVRDFLLASEDNGIDESLKFALSLEYEDVVQHHRSILSQSRITVECLASGNIASRDATIFFTEARSMIEKSQRLLNEGELESLTEVVFPAPSIERMLSPGQEVQLHFASKNLEEENGAVLCTYQSSIPSFKGEGLSHPESLLSSSSIRLLCHMLREPLFDDLRTKQALGYVVSSCYEIGYSSQTNTQCSLPNTTPIDSISINILSRKMAPPDITGRIDEFLVTFRKCLESMPESEIRDHADALATKLLKPIQKLQTESSNHFARIQRYGPELYLKNARSELAGSDNGMPWETAQALAGSIQKLTRKDLIGTWDRMTHPSTRSRVISCVYGKTFPLKWSFIASPSFGTTNASMQLPFWGLSNRSSTCVINDFAALLQLRKRLPKFGPNVGNAWASKSLLPFSFSLQRNRRAKVIGLSVLGAAMIGTAIFATETNRRRRASIGNTKILASSVFFLVAIGIPIVTTAFVPSRYIPSCYADVNTPNGNKLIFNVLHEQFFTTLTVNNEKNGSRLQLSPQMPFAREAEDFGLTKTKHETEATEVDVGTLSSSNSHGLKRRQILTSVAAVSVLLHASALAVDAPPTHISKSLDDLRFGNGHWSPIRDENASSTNAGTSVPASFATYLTRFLINYDEGVTSWWLDKQHSYSLLPKDQQQIRLSQDFGKLAASVQRAIQQYVDEQGRFIPSLAYERIFERLFASFANSDDKDEVGRQLTLLAAILPPTQQPRELMRKQSRSTSFGPSSSLNEKGSSVNANDLSFIKADLSVLLPQQYTPKIGSDGFLSIYPPINLFEVGVGEEFGQAATATTFGPLAAAMLTRDLPSYSFDIYALFGISGATGCCLTHSLVIPLDVIKTKEQVWSTEEGYKANLSTGAKRILQEEGISGLLTGAQATLAGYFWYGLSVYPSYTFFKRFLSHDALPTNLATSHTNDIALVAGALAAVVASLGLTPVEAARIRVVANPKRYRPLGLMGTLQVIAAEGNRVGLGPLKNLYAGFPSLLTRQVIFGSVKFLAFERACEFMYYIWPFLRDSNWTALSVSLVAGGFSGALSSVVSQPADAVLTYVAALEKSSGGELSSLGVLEGSRRMIDEGGISSLFRGLSSRCLWAAAIIAGQFLLYDVFRNYFGVNSEDLCQVFRIDLQ